jgi:hypothetical protein
LIRWLQVKEKINLALKLSPGLIQKLFYYQMVEIIILNLSFGIPIFLTLQPLNP